MVWPRRAWANSPALPVRAGAGIGAPPAGAEADTTRGGACLIGKPVLPPAARPACSTNTPPRIIRKPRNIKGMAAPHHEPLSDPPPHPPESHEPESNPPESHEPLSEPPPQPPESHEPLSEPPPQLPESLPEESHPPLLQLPESDTPGIHDGPPITGVATLQTPQAKTSMPTMISSQPHVTALRPGRVSIGGTSSGAALGIVHNPGGPWPIHFHTRFQPHPQPLAEQPCGPLRLRTI